MVIATPSASSVDSQSNGTVVGDDRDRVINSNSLESVRSTTNEVLTMNSFQFYTKIFTNFVPNRFPMTNYDFH